MACARGARGEQRNDERSWAARAGRRGRVESCIAQGAVGQPCTARRRRGTARAHGDRGRGERRRARAHRGVAGVRAAGGRGGGWGRPARKAETGLRRRSGGLRRWREAAAMSTTLSRRLATRERRRGREEDGNEVAGRRRGEVALVIRRRRTAAGAKGSGRRAIGRGRAGGRDRAGAPLPQARCVHECVCVCCVWWRRVWGRGERWGGVGRRGQRVRVSGGG